MERPISLPLYNCCRSEIEESFKRSRRAPSDHQQSDLLKSINSALRGSGADPSSSVHSTRFLTNEDPLEEEEVTWDDDVVVLSSAGVVKKKWSFELEGQPVQWACIGWMEQNGVYPSTHFAETSDMGSKSSSERSTFGPFFCANRNPISPGEEQETTIVSAVFVFLRSIGKIYLRSGFEYTFSLPFIVRRAWPITPHGVLIQRALEPTEVVEAEISGEAVLPTIFCLYSPFSEASPVGFTTGIIGGKGVDNTGQATLKDADENLTKPLKSISPDEVVVWASHGGPNSPNEIVVTLDINKRRLTIWRYAYVKPKDTPVPLGLNRTKTLAHQKRQSMSGVRSRRSSIIFPDLLDKLHPPSRPSSPTGAVFPEFPELPPLSALPGMPPSLSTTTTMASLASGSGFGSSSQSKSQTQTQTEQQRVATAPAKGRRNSLTRNDLSVTMNRMALGSRGVDIDALTPIEHGRMKTALWMDKVYETELVQADVNSYHSISVSLFDHRNDHKSQRSLLGICLPSKQSLMLFVLSPDAERRLQVTPLPEVPAISIAAVRATRANVWDLLVLKPNKSLCIMTHGTYEIPVSFASPPASARRTSFASDKMDVEQPHISPSSTGIASIACILTHSCSSALTTFSLDDGSIAQASISLFPHDSLTTQALQILALALPSDLCFALHHFFLVAWSQQGFSDSSGVEFECFVKALYFIFGLDNGVPAPSTSAGRGTDPWQELHNSPSHTRFRNDPVMQLLKPPVERSLQPPPLVHVFSTMQKGTDTYNQIVLVLYTLHTLAEELRLFVDRYTDLLRLAPIICRIAMYIRPEWADYWRRICPDATAKLPWPSPAYAAVQNLDDSIPVWPPDISAILYGRLSNPEWKVPWFDAYELATRFHIRPSFAYGTVDPLDPMKRLTLAYAKLADSEVTRSIHRAQNAVKLMVDSDMGEDFIGRLPLGIAAPLREAIRTCQLAPPPDWPLKAYKAIARDDVAASANPAPDMMLKTGYLTMKDFLTSSSSRQTISQIAADAKAANAGEAEPSSGVELDLDEFTSIRFGQDRRLEEIGRMLCSSIITTVRSLERPDANEHDQAKDHQMQVIRIAERTLALPYGRAMFTFGSISSIAREAFNIPKFEFSVKLHPLNVTVAPDPGKIIPESLHWGEFHNGVAAALRISSSSASVDSSWIAFNKPAELTPEHAGFLYGLGLTGHLKEMLTWHTFGYLTPKHDLTSIGVLLGLSAANLGNGNQHVTKLLAVHTPALLPTPTVDLNVPLQTQAAGLTGVGLLYMGTKNRRMAEVCLNQMSRKDLVQPDLSNEYREAYTYCAATAFGMVMLGKGTMIPADVAFLERLNILIHGDADFAPSDKRQPFDVNLTSPAASIALGLMYMKTERQDIADMLAIPDTILALHRIQPSFLLLRTLARALIMWNKIAPTNEWIANQIPRAIRQGIENRSKANHTVSDAWELAYYNIIAGCCFAIGLKYAGTARQEAYKMIIRYNDLFTRMVYSNTPSFDWRIKRSAVRDGLNLITISLSMVMAGTGEITCLKRLRYAYGMYANTMYHPSFKYGIHVATHQALGLLFLGGGRFTLGTSDAAIACMVTAFFPRTHNVSYDNKSYLQALRHLWVLAVEPRCLVARDVETKEVVYLPLKITMREGNEVGTTQLISPTLIPDLDKLISVRVDTPRYWPFHLDTEKISRHRESLLRSQTLYVKRRTAFLSYTEDPRGSRSLFVRSRSSAGDAATLDYPRLTDTETHPAGDLWEFITSFSNDPLFLAFADYFCYSTGETDKERLLHTYCHATLFDSILQGKPQTVQSHLTLFRYRTMSPTSRYFHLQLQDLRFLADFYGRVFDRRFSGRSENNYRTPLIRDSTVWGTMHDLDQQLDVIRARPEFLQVLGKYAAGTLGTLEPQVSSNLAWYLLRNAVPVSTLLVILKGIAADAHTQCLGVASPAGTGDAASLELGIREVLHATGTRMTTALGAGWSVRSLDEIIESWRL